MAVMVNENEQDDERSVEEEDERNAEEMMIEEEDESVEEEEEEEELLNEDATEEPGKRSEQNTEGESVKVFLRLRPHPKKNANGEESGEMEFGRAVDDALIALDDHTVQTVAPEDSQSFKNRETGGKFSFTNVFHKGTGQDELFRETTAGLVEKLVNEGRDGLLFAYGVTNAGKTHTVEGTEGNPGIIPRALQYVFDRIEARAAADQAYGTPTVEVSYLQVYNEEVHDLQALNEKSGSLLKERLRIKLREDGVEVVGLRSTQITSCREGLSILTKGREVRETHETQCNVASSRSHSVFCIQLAKAGEEFASEKPARLYIVDLAGSERAKRTMTSRARQREASNINCSLMNLMRCLDTLRLNGKNRRLGKKEKMVPFRESKLTLLFRDCFIGGNCGGVAMIVNASARPADYDETAHALKYGALVKEVQVTRSLKTRRASNVPQYAPNGRRIRRAGSDDPAAATGQAPQTPSQSGLVGGAMGFLRERLGMRSSFQASASRHRKGSLVPEQNPEIVDDEEISMDEHPLVSALVYELADARMRCVSMEAEIREEVAAEMAARLEEMEQVFRKRVDAATQISNAKSEHLLQNLRKRMQGSGGKSHLYTIEDIEQLAESLNECEEEMERMRQLHAADVSILKRQIEALQGQNTAQASGGSSTAAGEATGKDDGLTPRRQSVEGQSISLSNRRKSHELNRQSFERLDVVVNEQLATIARVREELEEERGLHEKTIKQLESATQLAKDAQHGEAEAERQVVSLRVEVEQLRERLHRLTEESEPLPMPPRVSGGRESVGLLRGISSPGLFAKVKKPKAASPAGEIRLAKHFSADMQANSENLAQAGNSFKSQGSTAASSKSNGRSSSADWTREDLQEQAKASEPVKRGLVSRMVGRMRR